MAAGVTMSQLAPTVAPAGHMGVQVAGGTVTLSGTTSATDLTIFLCQVPNHCTILDWTLFVSDADLTIGGANQRVIVGTSASPSGLGAFSLSGSASSDVVHYQGRIKPRGFENLMPVRISLSDNPGNASVWLTAGWNVAPSTSETAIICNFQVLYTMGGHGGHTTSR